MSYLKEDIDENHFAKIGELLPYFLCLVLAMHDFNCNTAILIHQMGLHRGCLLHNVCSSFFLSRNGNLCSTSLLCELSFNFSAIRVWSVSSKKGAWQGIIRCGCTQIEPFWLPDIKPSLLRLLAMQKGLPSQTSTRACSLGKC